MEDTIIDTIKKIYNKLFVSMLKDKNIEIKDENDFDELALEVADTYEEYRQDIIDITHVIYKENVSQEEEISILLNTYLYLLEEYNK